MSGHVSPAQHRAAGDVPARAGVYEAAAKGRDTLLPWIVVGVVLLVWGTAGFKALVNPYATWNYPVPELHNMISKVAPVVGKPTPGGAVFAFTWLSYTGSGMLIAAIISGFLMGFSPGQLVATYAGRSSS